MSNWEQVKIKDVANTMSGGTPNRSTLEFYEHGDIPWLKTGELKNKFIHHTEEMITELAVQKSSAKLVPENSVIVAMYGATVGNLSINKIPLTTNQACCSILPKEEKLNEEFLYYYLLKDKEKLIKMAAGGAQPNISQQLIKDYEILLPSLKEQQKIAEILSSVDAAIEKTEQVIAKTEEVKKGLMQQLLTKGIG
ncbi:MAG: restriction endonuclease subunit S, partial [Turicibacter sp.]